MKAGEIIDKFSNAHVLVIGDIMLDKYIWGEVARVSPEAPVPVVNVKKENYIPGGAGNAANNVASLGGKVTLVGVVGNDPARHELVGLLKKNNIIVDHLIVDEKRPTIQKVRVIGQNQQLLRFDYENKDYLNEQDESKFIDAITSLILAVDVVIVSDYAKGVITATLMTSLISLAKEHGKRVIVDPKPKHKNWYKHVSLVTPNHREAHAMTGVGEQSDEGVETIGRQLMKDLDSDILITRGEKGMSLFAKDGTSENIRTHAKEVYDVSGAGDTVIATLALALASGAALEEAAMLANIAAGITVGKIGTSTVSIEEFKEAIADE